MKHTFCQILITTLYTPSTLAKKLFFYPICIGSFRYESGYRLARDSYDSFLIMYILKGTCFVTVGSHTMQAMTGQLIFLDCYAPHAYGTDSGFEALWIHFDGPMARIFYETIVSEKSIFALSSSPGCHPQISSIISTILSAAVHQLQKTRFPARSQIFCLICYPQKKRNKFPAKRRLVYLKPFHTSTNIFTSPLRSRSSQTLPH